MKKPDIPGVVCERLSLYLRRLEKHEREGREKVSSEEMGRDLGVSGAQVRRDLTYFGQFGRPGLGYKVAELKRHLQSILGVDGTWRVVLAGVGNIGRALVSYKTFRRRGFEIVAAFDTDRRKVGTVVEGVVVYNMSELAGRISSLGAQIAVVAVPPSEAQDVVDKLADAGIRAILNFAPVALSPPEDVCAISVDLTLHLEQLSYYLKQSKSE